MNRNTDISPEEFESIERYLLKQMPADEYNAFAKKILNDTALQNKVDSVKLMLVGIEESALTEKLEDFHQEISLVAERANRWKNKVFSMNRWLVAASIIILVGVSALLLFTNSNKQERLFSEYYKPDPGLLTAMGASENYSFEHAMIDYKTKKYDSAIQTWKGLLKSNPTSDTLNYFIGSAFLAKDNSDSAIHYFQNVVSNPHSSFLNDANWYLGLALVKQQKSRKAILFIEKSNHQNKEAILEKLKK